MFVRFDVAVGVCEIGCWLEPSAEGKGLIVQVVRALSACAGSRAPSGAPSPPTPAAELDGLGRRLADEAADNEQHEGDRAQRPAGDRGDHQCPAQQGRRLALCLPGSAGVRFERAG